MFFFSSNVCYKRKIPKSNPLTIFCLYLTNEQTNKFIQQIKQYTLLLAYNQNESVQYIYYIYILPGLCRTWPGLHGSRLKLQCVQHNKLIEPIFICLTQILYM